MRSGFTKQHFEILKIRGGNAYDKTAHAVDVAHLKEAYAATEAWAVALRGRCFPDGQLDIRKDPINRGTSFSSYNWAKIYPSKDAPRSLAFTVGIDASGDFIVKIDTVRALHGLRTAYERELGPTFHAAPFAAVLPARDGLSLSREELVAWSADAIANFWPDYDELAARLALAQPSFRLLTDAAVTTSLIGRWLDALSNGAVRHGGVEWIPECRIVTRSTFSSGLHKVQLGDDPTGRSWAVEINEPRIAGHYNSLTAIAVNRQGRHVLVRQGILHPNGETREMLSSEDFAARTSARSLSVEASDGGARRRWFLVAYLDEDHAAIRRMTGDFVDQCLVARRSVTPGANHPAGEPSSLDDRRGEVDGSYKRGARPAVGEHDVLRLHGTVWLKLKEKLAAHRIGFYKTLRHGQGFEIDGVVEHLTGAPMLVEIKTSISSNDIHTGIGQLHLYRRLFPNLGAHAPVLLLPDWPSRPVIEAIHSCGIAVHRYDFGENPQTDITFDSGFLVACGVAPINA